MEKRFERQDLEAGVNALTELMLEKSRYAIRRSKCVLNNAADGVLSQVAAFELPIDPAEGPLDVHGIEAFAAKRPDL
jgi:hypothetical protein